MDEGAPGDLYIRIKQARHPRFVREGYNLRA
jgi:DnaJ-class molecular chaperone